MNWETMSLVGLCGVFALAVTNAIQRRFLPLCDRVTAVKGIVSDIFFLVFLASFPLIWVLPEAEVPWGKYVKLTVIVLRCVSVLYLSFYFKHLTLIKLPGFGVSASRGSHGAWKTRTTEEHCRRKH